MHSGSPLWDPKRGCRCQEAVDQRNWRGRYRSRHFHSRSRSSSDRDAQPADRSRGRVRAERKTLSFTTVIALARDNGYRLIIAVAGNIYLLTKPVHPTIAQRPLCCHVDGYLRWSTFTNLTTLKETGRPIEQVLDEWRDPLVPPDERPTVLITVMKNHRHLANLFALLSRS